MAVTIKHAKTDTIADWTQSDLDAQIAAGNYPAGTVLADIVLPSDWNNDHTVTGLGTMATQDANNVSITGGSISGATVSGYIPTTQKGIANGVATLDSGGQIPLAQIPPLGDLNYQGTWNASTNTPTLTSSVGTKGYYYVVSVAGTTNLNGITDWQVGDWAVYNGSAWQKIDNTDAVTSVNGKTGTVVLTYSDVGAQPAGTYVNNITSTDGSVTVTGTTTVDLSVATAASTQNVLCQIRNTTGATLTKGTVVYISGATGQIPTVSKAIATGDATSAQTLGMMTADLANNSNGYVTIIGLITDIDTSAYTDGQQLYLSGTTAGAVTGTKPKAPTHLVYVAVVEYAHPVHGKLFVKVQNGYELDEIHDVQITSPANGQTILYDASTSLWKNANLTAGTGISISNGAASATITNSAPDQTVSITGAGGAVITGTYPNFTITTPSGTVTSVTGTSPIASTGGATPAISISQATASTNGYLSSVDWNTFNNKQPAGTYVTSVTATSPVTSTGGTTPIIAMPAATTSVSGYLTSTDWNTFNNKVSMTYPGAGIPNSTGSAWGTSYTTTGSGTVVALSTSPTFATSILGDFSNATVASRTLFKTSTTNSATGIYAVPNGTSTAASWQATNAADPTNASKILIATNGSTDVQLVSGINGTGTYLPMTFWNNGAEKARLSVAGGLSIGTTTDPGAGGLQVAGTANFTGSTSVLAAIFANAAETTTVSATAATGTINFDISTQSVLYYTTNASANFTLNFRMSSGTSLNTAMSTGQTVTVVFLCTNGATAYYNNAVTVDGNSVTPKYQGGTAWTSGNASGIDAYTFTIIKTGSAAFTVLTSQTQFK